MQPEPARNALDRARAALSAPGADAAVTTVLVRGGGLVDGDPTTIDFEADVAAEVIRDVLAFATDLAGRELLPYDPSYQVSSGQALVDDLAQSPDLERLQGAVDGGALAVGDTGDDRPPIAAMAHRVDCAAGPSITVWRVKGPGIATKRASGLRILIPRSGVYERLRDEIVYYQPRFDALVVDGVVFVTAPTTLQRSLGSPERARTMARETFARATATLDIEGARELRDAVSSDPAMIAKMAQLHRTLEADPSYAHALTTKNLLAFLDANPQIPITTEGEGAARHLVFEPSPQTRYLIPKALADDFLRSELTDRHYEAGSKQRIDG